jgi:hypothetical protein
MTDHDHWQQYRSPLFGRTNADRCHRHPAGLPPP